MLYPLAHRAFKPFGIFHPSVQGMKLLMYARFVSTAVSVPSYCSIVDRNARTKLDIALKRKVIGRVMGHLQLHMVCPQVP